MTIAYTMNLTSSMKVWQLFGCCSDLISLVYEGEWEGESSYQWLPIASGSTTDIDAYIKHTYTNTTIIILKVTAVQCDMWTSRKRANTEESSHKTSYIADTCTVGFEQFLERTQQFIWQSSECSGSVQITDNHENGTLWTCRQKSK